MATHSKEQTTSLVHQFLKALVSRDLDSITALFADDLDWYIPGNEQIAPWLGRRETRKQITDFYKLLWEYTEPVSAQVDHIFVEEGFAAIIGEFTTRMLPKAKTINSMFTIQISFENGLITRYRLLEDSYAVWDAMR